MMTQFFIGSYTATVAKATLLQKTSLQYRKRYIFFSLSIFDKGVWQQLQPLWNEEI